MRYSLLIATALLACAATARAAETVKVLESMDAKLQLGTVTFAGGKTLDLTIGIGSALFHMPGDPADEFYALTDRGPNIDCSASEKITGIVRTWRNVPCGPMPPPRPPSGPTTDTCPVRRSKRVTFRPP